jgi:hypothetical protein
MYAGTEGIATATGQRLGSSYGAGAQSSFGANRECYVYGFGYTKMPIKSGILHGLGTVAESF